MRWGTKLATSRHLSHPPPLSTGSYTSRTGSTPFMLKVPTILSQMNAARLHTIGAPLQIDRIPVPEPRPGDVLIQVKFCGVVPNMRRVMSNFFGTQTTDHKLFPSLPAIFGLDPVGKIAKLGDHVTGMTIGDRVYVNPARSCGSCRMCRAGEMLDCPSFTFQGYFGRSKEIMAAYPYGGFAQYITAPATALVALPDGVRFESAARLGYIGTAYAAMKKIHAGPGRTLLINGISGTLGLCAAMLGLAMGASLILGTGRNRTLLKKVAALAPGRIQTFAMDDDSSAIDDGGADPLRKWAHELTDGGVDCMLDCLPPGAPAQMLNRALHCLRRGGFAANVGAVTEPVPLDTFWMMTNRIHLMGSVWFTTAEGEEIVSMATTGHLNLSALEHEVFPLSKINEALSSMGAPERGGFPNYLIDLD